MQSRIPNQETGQAGGGIPRLALTRKEVAEALGITPFSVDRLRRRGLLHASTALGRPLYPVDEIRRFLEVTSSRYIKREAAR